MANAPDTSTYLLVSGDVALPNSRVLIAAPNSGLATIDAGAGSTLSLDSNSALKSIQNISSLGILTQIDVTTKTYAARTLQSSTISITNPSGTAGNPVLDVIENTTNQRVKVSYFGTLVGTRRNINFKTDSSAGVHIVDNTLTDSVDVTLSATGAGAASKNLTFLLATADGSAPNAQSLDNLSNGILKNNNSVLAIATPGTDYQAASAVLTSIAGVTPANGSLLVGNGTGFSDLGLGTNGYVPTSNGTTIVWAPGGTGSGAPANATYITQTANGLLSNNQVLASLITGIVKNTTGTGVLSIAAAGTDYLAPSVNLTSISGTTNALGSLLLGTGSGYTALGIGANTYVLTSNGTNASWQPASGGGGGAPTTSTYILQVADAMLPNAQSMGALGSGLVKNTTTTGVQSIATAGTDYYSPANPTTLRETANNLFIGNGTGALITGTGNTAAGFGVLQSAVNSSNCTVFGYRAYNAFTGTTGRNVGIGHRAGETSTGTNDNVLIGYLAGQNLGNAGAQNVFIGSSAITGSFALSSSVAVGYNIQTTSNSSNAIAIGSGLTIVAGNTTQIGNNAYCGIGVQSPAYTLDIGNITVSSVVQPASIHLARTAANPNAPANGGVLFFNSSDQPKFRNVNSIYTLWGSSASSTAGGIPIGTSTDGIFTNLAVGSNMMSITTNGTTPGWAYPQILMYQATLGTGSTSTAPGAKGTISFTPDAALLSILQNGFNSNAGTLVFDFTMQFQMSMGLVSSAETVQFIISSNAVPAVYTAGKGTTITPTAFSGWSVTQVNCPVQLVDIVNASNTTFTLSWANNATLATLNRNLASSFIPVYLLPNGFL